VRAGLFVRYKIFLTLVTDTQHQLTRVFIWYKLVVNTMSYFLLNMLTLISRSTVDN